MSFSRRAPHLTLPSRRARDLVLAGPIAAALLSMTGAGAAFAADAPQGPDDGPSKAADVAAVVVNGVAYKDTVLPTRMSSSSTFGLDLSVMDTPRNTTLLSPTQLQTINVQDPRAFSYLTASSYSDSSFGTPNIPRIRGQYSDVFYNGMRASLTQNGYGVPPSFDDFDNLSITKGPASVVDGPGMGVGGQVDFITKVPSLTKAQTSLAATIDTVGNHRLSIDIGGPITPGVLAVRISYAGENSGSYFYDHNSVRNALYADVRWRPNEKYEANFNAEILVGQYTENVGLNRVTQALIDNNTYSTGVATGGQLYYYPQVPIAGNPNSLVVPFGTEVLLTGTTPINTRITVDQAPGTTSNALRLFSQFIQNFYLSDDLSLENNTFINYQDSDNQEAYYYADASRGSYTVENRTLLKDKKDLDLGLGAPMKNQAVAGFTVRFAHVNYVSNYDAEAPSTFDLTTNPALWGVPTINFTPANSDAFLYKSPFGHFQYGSPGRDTVNRGNTGISDLIDAGVFFEDRLEVTPKFSLLFGVRMDVAQNHAYDPFPCLEANYCNESLPNLPQSHSTGDYGLGNANFSAVYRWQPWISSYATFNFSQAPFGNGGEGGVNTYTQVPDHALMRQSSFLYEAGLKLNLLNNKLFAGTAVFDQKRAIPVGVGGTQISEANIRGVEIELNYQPTRQLFATASYSYIETTLSQPSGFYNYPAEIGNQYPGQPYNFIDGAGTGAVFATGQKFNDPGVPNHVFNLLANYKFDNGVGIRSGVQVTGPIETSQSGQLNLAASSNVPEFVIQNKGYFKSPGIPWQYTWNAAIFYSWDKYTVTASVYNITNQINWQSSPNFYGNDMLVRNDPRTFELRLAAKY